MPTFEGYPSEEDALTSRRMVLMDLFEGQHDVTSHALADGVIDEADVMAAELAFDEEHIMDEFRQELGEF